MYDLSNGLFSFYVLLQGQPNRLLNYEFGNSVHYVKVIVVIVHCFSLVNLVPCILLRLTCLC